MGQIFGKLFTLIVVQGPPEIVFLYRGDQISIADFAQHQIHTIGIHAFDGQGGICAAGQDIGTARKPNQRGAITHIEDKRHILVQHLAAGRWQTGAKRHLIARTVLHAINANLLVFGFDRKTGTINPDERRVICAGLDQLLRKLGTDPRGGGIAIHAVVRDPKPVFPNRVIQCGQQIGALGICVCKAQNRDHVAPTIIRLERLGKQFQRQYLLRWIGRAQVSVYGGPHRVTAQTGPLLIIQLGILAQANARQLQPEHGVIRARDRLPR